MGEGSVEKGGGISGDSDKDKHGREEVHSFNSRKEFGYDIRKTKARPSNTAIIDVVLAFLRDTKVGIVKEESSMYVDLFLPLSSSLSFLSPAAALSPLCIGDRMLGSD